MSDRLAVVHDTGMRQRLMDSLRSGSFPNYAALHAGCSPRELYRLREEAKFLRGETTTKPAFMPDAHAEQPLRDEIVGLVDEMDACEAEFCEELVERARHLALDGTSIKDVLALLSTRFPDWKEDNAFALSAAAEAFPSDAGTVNRSPDHILKVLDALEEVAPQIRAARKAQDEGTFDPEDYEMFDNIDYEGKRERAPETEEAGEHEPLT